MDILGYKSCGREDCKALVEMAQKEADQLMQAASKLFGDEFSARAYPVYHGDHYSIAGALRENGQETRHFDPITLLFEDVKEQMIIHLINTEGTKHE